MREALGAAAAACAPAALRGINLTFHRRDNFSGGDFVGRPCQAVTASGAADGLHQFGAPQLTENLFKIGH